MMSITTEEYETQYWPKLEHAIQHLLTTKPSEYIPISYEQMYTYVAAVADATLARSFSLNSSVTVCLSLCLSVYVCRIFTDAKCRGTAGFPLTWKVGELIWSEKVREKSGNFVDGQGKVICIV